MSALLTESLIGKRAGDFRERCTHTCTAGKRLRRGDNVQKCAMWIASLLFDDYIYK